MKQIKFIAAIAVMAITTVNVWQANKSTEKAQASYKCYRIRCPHGRSNCSRKNC